MITTSIATVQGSKGNRSELYILDTVYNESILSYIYLNQFYSIEKSKSMYSRASGLYKANKYVTIILKLPGFSSSKDIIRCMDIRDTNGLEYDVFIERYWIEFLWIIFDFKYQVLRHDDIVSPMNNTKTADRNRNEIILKENFK